MVPPLNCGPMLLQQKEMHTELNLAGEKGTGGLREGGSTKLNGCLNNPKAQASTKFFGWGPPHSHQRPQSPILLSHSFEHLLASNTAR